MKRAILTAVLLSFSVLPAQESADLLVGDWQGALEVQGMKLRIALHVARGDDGYLATIDSLDQGAKGIEVDELTMVDGEVVFSVDRIRGRYEGQLVSGDVPEIRGTWSQGGMQLSLVFLPQGEAEPLRRPQQPVEPYPYRSEDVAYHYTIEDGVESFELGRSDAEGAITLGGTLTLPDGDGPHPAAVLISGSGPQDRDETLLGHKPFLVLSDHLTRRGFAVLRYDDRGVDESTGDFSAATSEDLAEDARAGLRYLRSRADIDPQRIGFIGHSEGGLIAPMIAAGDDAAQVAFVVMLAGPGVTGEEIVLHQSRLISRADGAADADLDVSAQLEKRLFEALRTIEDGEARRTAMEAMAREAWDELSEAARAEAGSLDNVLASIQRMDQPWMRFFATYDPAPALRRMRCPVLAMTGEKDLQVDPAQNHPVIRAAFEQGEHPDYTIVEMPGLNHLFQTCETGAPSEYQSIEETFAPAALERLSDWLETRFLE